MQPLEESSSTSNNDDALRSVLTKLQCCEDIGDDEAFRTRAAHLVERLDQSEDVTPLLQDCFELLKLTPVFKLQSDLRQEVLETFTYLLRIVELPVLVNVLFDILKIVASGSATFVHPVASAVVKQAIANAQELGHGDRTTMDECLKMLTVQNDFSWLGDVLRIVINSMQDFFPSCEARMPNEPLENASQP